MTKSSYGALALFCILTGCSVKTEKAVDSLAVDTSSATNAMGVDTLTAVTPPPATGADVQPPRRPTTPPPMSPDTSSPTPAMTVTEFGIGPVRAGMTVAEASRAMGGGIAPPRGGSTGCGYAVLTKAPAGLAMMVENGKIARVEVRSGRTPTSLGARIGDSEARIKSLYAGRVVSTPHKYVQGGHYLTVSPVDGGSSRIVFETDGKVVTEYRSGAQPAVEYVERCG